jgi:hypothetical protein
VSAEGLLYIQSSGELTAIMIFMISPPMFLFKLIFRRSNRVSACSSKLELSVSVIHAHKSGTDARLNPPIAESVSLLYFSI